MPTLEEVTGTIVTLKLIKAAGSDAIQAELLNYGGLQLHAKLYQIISELWNTEPVRQVWKNVNLITIFMSRCDTAYCGNSGGFASTSVVGGVLAKIHPTQNCSQHN